MLIAALLIAVSIVPARFDWERYLETPGKTAPAATHYNSTTSSATTSPPLFSRDTSDPAGKASAQDDLPTFTVPVHVKDIINTHFPEPVNQEYGIQDASGSSLVSAWPTVPVLSEDITLDKTALEAVKEMFSAASAAHSGSFYISSGYRSCDHQAQVYDSETDKSYAQTPGHSEHETGLAADIMGKGLTQQEMGSSPQGEWLDENSWKYGLIWRYPQEKQSITGISYEPWHSRDIGQPHACTAGKKYSVLYETPKKSIITL